jgi:hypothetical protein
MGIGIVLQGGGSMSRLANLGLILTSPTAVARSVMEDPHWVTPFIVVLAVSFIASVVTYEYQVEFQREYMGELILERDPDADLDSMFEVTPARRMLTGAAALAMGGVMVLVFAAILNGVGSVAGGRIGFRKMFSFMAYSSVIFALGNLIKIPLILAKGSLDVRTSLAAFAPSLDLRSAAAVFLSSFDIFTIWQIVALCFGYTVLSGFTIKKSSLIVVGLWAVLLVIRIGLSTLRAFA